LLSSLCRQGVPIPSYLLASYRPLPKPHKHPAVLFSACRQGVAIPSYLLALAVGHLERRELGPISAVWSEPEMVEAGAHEFAETPQFLEEAVGLVGPYVWGRYDLLLLPPSFPFGAWVGWSGREPARCSGVERAGGAMWCFAGAALLRCTYEEPLHAAYVWPSMPTLQCHALLCPAPPAPLPCCCIAGGMENP